MSMGSSLYDKSESTDRIHSSMVTPDSTKIRIRASSLIRRSTRAKTDSRELVSIAPA